MSPNPQTNSQPAQQKPRPNQDADKTGYGQKGKPSNKSYGAKDDADKECC